MIWTCFFCRPGRRSPPTKISTHSTLAVLSARTPPEIAATVLRAAVISPAGADRARIGLQGAGVRWKAAARRLENGRSAAAEDSVTNAVKRIGSVLRQLR